MLGKPRLGRKSINEILGLLLMVAGGAVLVIFLPGWFWTVIIGLGLIGGGLYLLWQR